MADPPCLTVECSAIDACHVAGECQEFSGNCTNPPNPAGCPEEGGNSTIWIYVIAAVGGLLLCIGIAVVAFLLMRRNKQKEEESKDSSHSVPMETPYQPVDASSPYVSLLQQGQVVARKIERTSVDSSWAIKFADIQIEKEIGRDIE